MDNLVPRHKWEILSFIGSPFPILTAIQKEVLRKQLDQKYCRRCGEYIYNPYRKRKLRHYHHMGYTIRSKPLLQERLLIHPRSHLVEWRRRFPNVMRLIISESDMFFYNILRPKFVHRIPSLRMWTIDEWNISYPNIMIQEDAGMKRLVNLPMMDTLYTPTLVL